MLEESDAESNLFQRFPSHKNCGTWTIKALCRCTGTELTFVFAVFKILGMKTESNACESYLLFFMGLTGDPFPRIRNKLLFKVGQVKHDCSKA